MALCLLALPGGCGPPPPAHVPGGEAAVWIIPHGWHAGLAVRLADLPPGAWPEAEALGEAAYLEVGWGEAGYFPDPAPGLLDVLRAGLWPTPSVLHVAALGLPPEEAFAGREVVRLPLSRARLRTLVEAVRAAYARDEAGRPRPLEPGLYGPRSRFYASRGRYHVFHNCNHWAAGVLAEAGLPFAPVRSLTLPDLMAQARRIRSGPR